jgi:hypothetical protein
MTYGVSYLASHRCSCPPVEKSFEPKAIRRAIVGNVLIGAESTRRGSDGVLV